MFADGSGDSPMVTLSLGACLLWEKGDMAQDIPTLLHWAQDQPKAVGPQHPLPTLFPVTLPPTIMPEGLCNSVDAGWVRPNQLHSWRCQRTSSPRHHAELKHSWLGTFWARRTTGWTFCPASGVPQWSGSYAHRCLSYSLSSMALRR